MDLRKAGDVSADSKDVAKPSARNLDTKKALVDVAAAWKAIQLDKRRNEWDAQAGEIVANQDASVASRKALATTTKDFRSGLDADTKNRISPLLKSYQEEIDKLTKRSKFAENAFVAMYKLLAEAPDPFPGLTAVLEDSGKTSRVAELEMENRKCKTELEEFRKEFQEIKNQEVTVRRLEDRIAEYEAKMDDLIKERVAESEVKFKEQQEIASAEFRERELELRRRLDQGQAELHRTQYLLERTQKDLNEARNRTETLQGSKQSEMDMLADENERLRSRVLQLERDLEKFAEGAPNAGARFSATMSPLSELELELAQKEVEILRLRDSLLTAELQVKQVDAVRHQVQEQLNNEKTRSAGLATELQSRPTVQEFQAVKLALQSLQRTLDYSEDSDGPVGGAVISVENMLKDKNRRLQTENMKLKASLAEKEAELLDLQRKLSSSQATGIQLQQLVQKLEEDLAAGGLTSVDTTGLQHAPALKSSGSNQSDVLQIVCNQRDRFKARVAQLEQEERELMQRLENKNNEISSLRNDNVKLYEKIKFLTSYGRDPEAGRVDDDIDRKYSKLYEESVNPFTLFNRKEKYQRYQQLSVPEKVIFNSSRMLLSTKYTRLFLFGYSTVLHLLVFLTLYKMASDSSESTACVST